jgi:hypothetical protein
MLHGRQSGRRLSTPQQPSRGPLVACRLSPPRPASPASSTATPPHRHVAARQATSDKWQATSRKLPAPVNEPPLPAPGEVSSAGQPGQAGLICGIPNVIEEDPPAAAPPAAQPQKPPAAQPRKPPAAQPRSSRDGQRYVPSGVLDPGPGSSSLLPLASPLCMHFGLSVGLQWGCITPRHTRPEEQVTGTGKHSSRRRQPPVRPLVRPCSGCGEWKSRQSGPSGGHGRTGIESWTRAGGARQTPFRKRRNQRSDPAGPSIRYLIA